jgi:hypothetical protein
LLRIKEVPIATGLFDLGLLGATLSEIWREIAKDALHEPNK